MGCVDQMMGRSNAVLGGEDHLIRHLEHCVDRAIGVRFVVAFLMESGAKLIGEALARAASRGVPIKILTSTYMSVTEPPALYYLLDVLGPRAEIRLFSDGARPFHPKAYLFDYEDDSEAYVGSSNLSASGLTYGIEWNYCVRASEAREAYLRFSQGFDDLFWNRSNPLTLETLKNYAMNWRKARVPSREVYPLLGPAPAVPWPVPQREVEEDDHKDVPIPFGMQIEALYYLKRAREEGVRRGLVVAPTGIGKTYLAAFDSAEFSRVLFIAHREEILRQAEASFGRVRPQSRRGFVCGERRDVDADICFATIQTLAREDRLAEFPADRFDYMVVDEFHHAAADSYVKVLKHFQPAFVLALTATPYRMDNRDIYELCDDNVVYESYLKDAINRDLLTPFKYYGVFDSCTDYSKIDIRNGQYVVEQLERELSRAERADLVLEKYRQFAGRRTLGFCAGIAHAEYMARWFRRHGVKAAAVHSGGSTSDACVDRVEAVEALKEGNLQVIFSVDIFNEGVDIPCLDTVMFLRPTESFVVFLQQLGRGLRKYPGKDFLTVLDFIGNYKRAHYIPALLAGDNPVLPRKDGLGTAGPPYPEGCEVHFDFRLLDLFEVLRKNDPLPKRMMEEYFRLKRELGRRP
ncbi:MAG: DEAD/DEAH box helicase family protein, partial [Firmicutes bacterium]|nr:DEAD/DEAH box helicase family protein [Bacillota bacterium]